MPEGASFVSAVDLIVPVWNRPVETRACLAELARCSPEARLVLVDNGSDRETEQLLQEFAELLDERALLLRTERNQGFVRALNRGLERAEAPLCGVVKTSTLVGEGWLGPLLAVAAAEPDAGLLGPWLDRGRSGPGLTREADHGSFAVMLLRRKLYGQIGGFDEELDGDRWCLKDYTRRAWQAGFRTVAVAGVALRCLEETPYGSPIRRQEQARLAADRYAGRWGKERQYCIVLPPGSQTELLVRQGPTLLAAARQGHRLSLLLPARLAREARAAGLLPGHDNIASEGGPRLFPGRWLERRLAALRAENPALTLVAGGDAAPAPADAIPFAELERLVAAADRANYGR